MLKLLKVIESCAALDRVESFDRFEGNLVCGSARVIWGGGSAEGDQIHYQRGGEESLKKRAGSVC